jgi:hypothetical protein
MDMSSWYIRRYIYISNIIKNLPIIVTRLWLCPCPCPAMSAHIRVHAHYRSRVRDNFYFYSQVHATWTRFLDMGVGSDINMDTNIDCDSYTDHIRTWSCTWIYLKENKEIFHILDCSDILEISPVSE